MSKKYVYLFSEGNANMRELLGGKGANLAEMTNIGMPVPQGFTISTEACTSASTTTWPPPWPPRAATSAGLTTATAASS